MRARPRSTSPGSRRGGSTRYYERGLNAWDWAAGSLLVPEAGGTVEELSGEPFGLVAGPAPLVAALRPLVEA